MNKIATAAGLVILGAVTGAATCLAIGKYQRRNGRYRCPYCEDDDHCLCDAKARRRRLPSLIILVRHGESEGNADHTLFRYKPDNLVALTEQGLDQADAAGRRVEDIFQLYDKSSAKPPIRRIHLVVSPFERSLQTAATMRPYFEHRIVRTDIVPRIREQEFGNLQGDEFEAFRKEQNTVGRFWYRFPTGESGADVFDRVKSWWFETVMCVNDRVGYDPIDALVVVTHGLTMRFVLMQLYSWSPTTFHSVWNADNCDIYALRKDLSKSGMSPYVLDAQLGDMPRSSIDIMVEFRNGRQQVFKLNDYLSIPPPRTRRWKLVTEKLAEQYPSLDKDNIARLKFMPFTVGPRTVQGRTSSDAVECFEKGELRDLEWPPHVESSCRFPNLESVLVES